MRRCSARNWRQQRQPGSRGDDVNNQVDPATASEYSAEIAPSETEWGTILGDYMKQSLTPGPVIEEVNPPYTGHHEADVAMGIASSAGFTVAKVEETDLTNIVPSFQGVTREGLEAYPSAKYILVPGNFAPGIIKPILKLVNRGDVTNLARYDTGPTIALMRQGVKIVDVTTNLYKPGLLALDADRELRRAQDAGAYDPRRPGVPL